MKQILIPLVSLSALVACDMNGDAGTEGSGLWSIRYKSAEEQIAYFTLKCEKYGYEKTTDAMRDCIADEMRNID